MKIKDICIRAFKTFIQGFLASLMMSMNNLSNFDILSEVIRNDDDGFNRHWACEKITDKDYLVKLIFNKLFYHRLDDLSSNSNKYL